MPSKDISNHFRIKLTKFLQLVVGCSLFSISAPGNPPNEPIHVVMQLDWILNAQFAGLYQAREQGYFEELGITVEIRPSLPEQNTVDAVLSEIIAFGSAESNVLLTAKAEGAPITAVATMFQGSPLGWMFLKSSQIQQIEDFAGKTIGIHPDGEKVLNIVTRDKEVSVQDFKLPHVGYDVSIILDGSIDAMQGYYIDEFVKLQLLSKNNAEMILARDLGYSAYSQVIFTSSKLTKEQPQLIKDFLLAVQKGWEFALDHPDETLALILKINPELDPEYQRASLARIDELVRPNGASPLTMMQKEVWEKSMTLYLKYGIIQKEANLNELLNFDFNPPANP